MIVEVECEECDVIMKPSGNMYQTLDGKTQSREYTCSKCKKSITVILTKDKDEYIRTS